MTQPVALTRAGDTDAIRLTPEDNVATVLRAVQRGERLQVRCGDAVSDVLAREAIPLCHKISLAPIAAGASVVKYGQRIGESLVPIADGHHVHVHNMHSARAKAPVP